MRNNPSYYRICPFCDGDFKTNSEYKVYCSRKCKEKAKIKRRKFFKTSDWKLVSSLKICEICENKDLPHCILETHHLDHDKNNNVLRNLLRLCPNCHKLLHMGFFRIDMDEKRVSWIIDSSYKYLATRDVLLERIA